jgi:hypothetical protein
LLLLLGAPARTEELFRNADFEQGAKHFGSDYRHCPGDVLDPGTYDVDKIKGPDVLTSFPDFSFPQVPVLLLAFSAFAPDNYPIVHARILKSVPMHRMRPFLFLFFGIMATLATGLWLVWPRTAITRENAAKIRNGMSLADVQALLGGPARDDSTSRLMFADGPGQLITINGKVPLENDAPFPAYREWISDTVIVTVIFDENGLVDPENGAKVCEVRPVPEALVEKLRRWLGL